MLNRKQGSHPLSRLLIDKSRASLSFGLLVYFIVHATLEGCDDDDKSVRCETLLMELEAAVLDGYRNVDLTMIEAFNTHNRQYRINKGYASLDDTDINILIKTESSVRKTAYNIYEHLEVHTEDLMPGVAPLTAHDMNNLRQLCSEVLSITRPETLMKLRRNSNAELDPPSLNQSLGDASSSNNTNRSSTEEVNSNADDNKDLSNSSVDSLGEPKQSFDLNDSDPMISYEKKLLAIEGLHLGLREPKSRDAKVKIANEQRGIVIGGRHRSVSDLSLLMSESQSDQLTANNINPSRASNTLYSTVAAKECLFDYFHAEMKFINALTGVSAMLKDLGLKKKELKSK
jgi:hypothetical protein